MSLYVLHAVMELQRKLTLQTIGMVHCYCIIHLLICLSDINHFRRRVEEASAQSDVALVAAFARATLGQTGVGMYPVGI